MSSFRIVLAVRMKKVYSPVYINVVRVENCNPQTAVISAALFAGKIDEIS
jgi:hypothetical protein